MNPLDIAHQEAVNSLSALQARILSLALENNQLREANALLQKTVEQLTPPPTS